MWNAPPIKHGPNTGSISAGRQMKKNYLTENENLYKSDNGDPVIRKLKMDYLEVILSNILLNKTAMVAECS